jgi:IclR family pca regulon transcriptional regulator
MSRANETAQPREFVRALERGLAVLRTFNEDSDTLTITELAQRAGMTKAAARRFLLTLTGLGYAHFDGRTYSLRPRALEIGGAYLSSIRLPELATPHLEVLAATVRETTSLTVLDDCEVVYVARVHGHRLLSASIQVGTRFPALLTSTGRVMLSEWSDEELKRLMEERPLHSVTSRTIADPAKLLSEIQKARQQGWAMADQELDPALRSIAVPVRDVTGAIVAAANVSAHTSRASRESLKRDALAALMESAANIESELASAFPEGVDAPLRAKVR